MKKKGWWWINLIPSTVADAFRSLTYLRVKMNRLQTLQSTCNCRDSLTECETRKRNSLGIYSQGVSINETNECLYIKRAFLSPPLESLSSLKNSSGSLFQHSLRNQLRIKVKYCSGVLLQSTIHSPSLIRIGVKSSRCSLATYCKVLGYLNCVDTLPDHFLIR